MHSEHFLLAALRSYQQMHANYFEDLEEAAASYRRARRWSGRKPPAFPRLRAILEQEHGYLVDEDTLPAHPQLKSFRSVFRDGQRPTLLINGRLMPSQKGFVLAREIGYRVLGLKERALTSTWIKVESFEQVLNNFKASYFAGALLMDRDALREDLRRFFARPKWDGKALLEAVRRYDATPETFYYRLTQLIPRFFGLREIFFMRFSHAARSGSFELTKVFNLSHIPVPHGVGAGETYCRRWPGLRLLNEMERKSRARNQRPVVSAQRSHFLDDDAEFFVIAMARPLALSDRANSSVSLGFLLDDTFRERVRFWNDPAVPRVEVNLTCERCRLAPEECRERAAPPILHEKQEQQNRKEDALRRLLKDSRPPLAGCLAAYTSEVVLDPGRPFPPIALRDEKGQIAEVPPGEMLYGFFKTTCPTCELAWPYFDRIARIGEGGSLSVRAVSQDEPDATRRFYDDLGVQIPTLYDAGAVDRFRDSRAGERSDVPDSRGRRNPARLGGRVPAREDGGVRGSGGRAWPAARPRSSSRRTRMFRRGSRVERPATRTVSRGFGGRL